VKSISRQESVAGCVAESGSVTRASQQAPGTDGQPRARVDGLKLAGQVVAEDRGEGRCAGEHEEDRMEAGEAKAERGMSGPEAGKSWSGGKEGEVQ
jgi:hypothetical protein